MGADEPEQTVFEETDVVKSNTLMVSVAFAVHPLVEVTVNERV